MGVSALELTKIPSGDVNGLMRPFPPTAYLGVHDDVARYAPTQATAMQIMIAAEGLAAPAMICKAN